MFLAVAFLTPADYLDAGWRARAKREVRQQWASSNQAVSTQRATVLTPHTQPSQPVAASMCGNPSCPAGCSVDCICEGIQQPTRIVPSRGGSKSITESTVLTASAFNMIPDDNAAFAVAQDPVTAGQDLLTAIDLNPMADDLLAVSTSPVADSDLDSTSAPAPQHILTYAEAYRSPDINEFILVVGPEQTASMMQDIVSCPVAHASSLGATPAGIYRVYDSPNGKLMTPWTSTEDIATDKWQTPPAKSNQQQSPQWQRVCTPQGCQWILVK